MEEDRCVRCTRTKDEVKLLDAISENELIKICEECALIEDLPIIRRPSSGQLDSTEKTTPVRQRMLRMAGLPQEKKQDQVQQVMNKLVNPTIDSLRKKDYKTILDERFSQAKKNNRPLNLVDNYNWLITMERKRRKIDRTQLAKAIGVNETAVKMIELKQVPDDALQIITRIEQYLGLRLRIQSNDEIQVKIFMKQLSTSPTNPEVKKEIKQKAPSRIIKFNPDTTKSLTIADLQRIKQAREQAEMPEETEEILGKQVEFSDEEN